MAVGGACFPTPKTEPNIGVVVTLVVHLFVESEVIVERSSLNNVSGGKIIFAPILIDTLFSEVKIYESQICRIRELGFVPCQ